MVCIGGCYWVEKTLVFPFNSKFLTFKHTVAHYPCVLVEISAEMVSFSKKMIAVKIGYVCNTSKGWKKIAKECEVYPNALN